MNSRCDPSGDSTIVADAMTIAGSTPMADATVVGDAPTRLRSVSTWLAMPEQDAAQSACTLTAPRAVSTRKGIVLSAALAASFALGVIVGSMGTRRAEASNRQAPVSPPAVTAIATSRATASSDGTAQPEAKPASEFSPVKPAGRDAGRGSYMTAPGIQTKACVAADAFATGDYARALGVYEELAAEQPENRAYVHAANILRSWVPPVTHAMRQPLPMKEPQH